MSRIRRSHTTYGPPVDQFLLYTGRTNGCLTFVVSYYSFGEVLFDSANFPIWTVNKMACPFGGYHGGAGVLFDFFLCRFFLGGPLSVRGFSTKGIGPRSESKCRVNCS